MQLISQGGLVPLLARTLEKFEDAIYYSEPQKVGRVFHD